MRCTRAQGGAPQQTCALAPSTRLGLLVSLPSALRRSCQARFMASPPRMQACAHWPKSGPGTRPAAVPQRATPSGAQGEQGRQDAGAARPAMDGHCCCRLCWWGTAQACAACLLGPCPPRCCPACWCPATAPGGRPTLAWGSSTGLPASGCTCARAGPLTGVFRQHGTGGLGCRQLACARSSRGRA